MKKLLLILFCLPLLIMAQAPQGFTYQGVATDNNGFELQNQNISIKVTILSASATGNVVWQETHATTTDTFGLFNVTIGEGTSTNSGSSATFQEIDWGAASHFMKVEIDVNGGSNYVHVGTSQMMSVPYALYAENVHNLNMDSILGSVYDSIAGIVANDSSVSQNLYLQCVDMGVSIMCPGLGLDPSASLSSTNSYNYPMSNDDYLNSNNYINEPHWRKFKIVGLESQISSGGDLMFKHKYNYGSNTSGVIYPQITMITPEIVNGEVYFYMHEVNGSSGHCVNESNISMSIPLANSFQVYFYSSWSGGNWSSAYRDFFEIFYESDYGFKSTGIIFDR
jgi:hypothetical protein